MEHKLKILEIEFVTHDVKRFIVEKPKGFSFIPGQYTMIEMNGFEKKKPFTITSLNEDLVLEFMIKIYEERDGFTKKLDSLKPGDEITIEDASGKLNYKGHGLFIAAGTGITPFIAVFRQLKKEGKLQGNKLIFSNKTFEDIILDDELRNMFKENATFVLTREEVKGFHYGRIDEEFLKEKAKGFGWFYVCGPKEFTLNMRQILNKFGVENDKIIT